LWIDPSSVVPNPQSKLLPIITDFHFDLTGLRVPEGVSKRLARNSIDFIPRDWKKISGRAFHFNVECRSIAVQSIGKRLSKGTNRANEVASG
jgi:hypothetical protein